jgi:DNA recombination protein RmuC
MLALQNDDNLFTEAFEKGICLVPPSILLFSLRTIANIWITEKQSRNAKDIAKRGGLLYDKFVGFHYELEKLGNSLGKSRDIYNESIKKLKDGKGNLAWQVEELKKMGLKTSKQLPENVLE